MSSDGRLLLVAAQRAVPTGEIAPKWLLIDLSAPSGPVVSGIVDDWLSDVEWKPNHDEFVLRREWEREWTVDIPAYIGSELYMRQLEGGGLAVLKANGDLVRTWDAAELGFGAAGRRLLEVFGSLLKPTVGRSSQKIWVPR